MPKIVFEADFREDQVKYEDGKQALLWDHDGFEILGDLPESADCGSAVKFWSWDDHRKHESIKRFIGKRVRITVEVINVLDRLAEIPEGEDEDVEAMLAKWNDMDELTDLGLKILRNTISEELRQRYVKEHGEEP